MSHELIVQILFEVLLAKFTVVFCCSRFCYWNLRMLPQGGAFIEQESWKLFQVPLWS